MASRTRVAPPTGQPSRRRRVTGVAGAPVPAVPAVPADREVSRRHRPPLVAASQPPAGLPQSVPAAAPPDYQPPYQPARRRRVVVGLAAEAQARADRARGGVVPVDAGRSRASNAPALLAPGRSGRPVPAPGSAAVRRGTCPCGLPASTSCVDGCGLPTCGTHLLNRASRLAWPGPYQSEREHTAYLRAFWANAAPLCSWCRETAGVAALAALPPVAPLPRGVLERLTVLLRHPHDYPGDAWEQTVQQQGGPSSVLRQLAPRLSQRKPAQEWEGRKNGEVLTGVSVGTPGAEGGYEVMDAGGTVWKVRPLGSGMMRKRRAWAWERVPDDRVARLLPRILDLAVPYELEATLRDGAASVSGGCPVPFGAASVDPAGSVRRRRLGKPGPTNGRRVAAPTARQKSAPRS